MFVSINKLNKEPRELYAKYSRFLENREEIFLIDYPQKSFSFEFVISRMAFAGSEKKESTIFIKNLPDDITTAVRIQYLH